MFWDQPAGRKLNSRPHLIQGAHELPCSAADWNEDHAVVRKLCHCTHDGGLRAWGIDRRAMSQRQASSTFGSDFLVVADTMS